MKCEQMKQLEFDFFSDYAANIIVSDLREYEKDRNYKFYKAQNDYYKTGDFSKLWDGFACIKGVCESIAKKKACGIQIPNLEMKADEAALRVMSIYKKNKTFYIRKLENVCYWKVIEVFYNKDLQITERSANIDDFYNLLAPDLTESLIAQIDEEREERKK